MFFDTPFYRLRPAAIAVAAAALLCSLAPRAGAQAPNPYRGQAEAIALGQSVYQANCARCHGDQASRPSAEAPDLRRLDSFCLQLKDEALAQRCLQDVDHYFLLSVRTGKVRAGIIYMPPWQELLTQQEIWSVRSFIASRPLDAPRLKTTVDAQHH